MKNRVAMARAVYTVTSSSLLGDQYLAIRGEATKEDASYPELFIESTGASSEVPLDKDNREGVQVATTVDKAKGVFTMEVAFPLKTEQYDYSQLNALSFNAARNVYTRNSYEMDVMLGWYPIFYTASVLESRGMIFFGAK